MIWLAVIIAGNSNRDKGAFTSKDRTRRFAGNYDPSGKHLIPLIKHSDAVLGVVLSMADRRQLLIGSKIDDIEKRLTELADLVRSQSQNNGGGKE